MEVGSYYLYISWLGGSDTEGSIFLSRGFIRVSRSLLRSLIYKRVRIVMKPFSFSAYSENVQYPLLSDRIAQQ